MANKLVIESKVYDKDSNGSVNKLLDNKDIVAGEGISVDVNTTNESVVITSDLGLKIVNGVPCAVFVVEE